MKKTPIATRKDGPGETRKRTATQPPENRNAEPIVKKAVKWMGYTKDVMSAFPDEVKQVGGEELFRIQCGLDANDAAPMGDVGPGTYEIVISKAGGWFRIFYVAKFGDAVYVLHAFQKKTNATSKGDIDIGKRRYALAEADSKLAAAGAQKAAPNKTKQ
ncbi:type II toxin-antitoxin system RelE/ParE family toxin [Massilia glaciei]|uniref:Type II toxin-antitoxin system RelE/ParE family toxin n=1 Tax=Massilia glaciei TaxID=1524097 RepID=A0A2U2HJV9_9BURK|nr:type II toxin-antitoxin system RelE/ParE family toxin [Massilia glaciei]PWF47753.1 hypothetical protein C7C56_013865 [Massilia glaciei]